MSDWPYLDTKPFEMRCVMAAAHLKPCINILEIGGYRTPISDYFEPGQHQVTVIDPRIDEYESYGVKHIKGFWQDHYFPSGPSWGFLCLGLEIHAPEHHWRSFIKFIDHCDKAVIGIACGFPHSEEQFGRIFQSLENMQLDFTVGLDLSDNQFAAKKVYAHRKLFFFSKRNEV